MSNGIVNVVENYRIVFNVEERDNQRTISTGKEMDNVRFSMTLRLIF